MNQLCLTAKPQGALLRTRAGEDAAGVGWLLPREQGSPKGSRWEGAGVEEHGETLRSQSSHPCLRELNASQGLGGKIFMSKALKKILSLS